MQVKKPAVDRAVDQPDPKFRFYLFSGQDEGQSRALAQRLLEGLGAAKFAISSGDIKASPSLLADEAAALSLFGERRLIWIEPATADICEGVEALLAAGSVESPVVAIAGALTKASPLAKLAEGSPLALAYTAYVPEGADAARMVSDIGRRVGLKVAPPIAARLAEACNNDQALVARELEKLALYVGASPHAPKDLDHDAIDAVGAESDEANLFKLGDLALLGDVDQVAHAIGSLAPGSSDCIPAMRALQRRILMLAPARAKVERGERVDAVMTSLGKSLFWKDKDMVAKMLRTWTADDLATIAARIGAVERNLMFESAPERESFGEELLTIARRARSAR